MSLSHLNERNDGVYELLTCLCEKTYNKLSEQNRIPHKVITAKMRSLSYEIILKKSPTHISQSKVDPFIDLLSHYFVTQQKTKNVGEYRRCTELKSILSTMRQTDFGENQDLVLNTLRLLNGLRDSQRQDISDENFRNPFSFGLLNEMLPKPKKEVFGSPEPYPFYPSYIFELPYTLKRQEGTLANQQSQCYTEYTMDSFDSKTFVHDDSCPGGADLQTYLSPMSLASMTSTSMSPYSESKIFNYPRLTAPRDLQIPSEYSTNANIKVSLVSTNTNADVKEVFRAKTNESVDIWELVTQIDKDVPEDIWDIVSKLPPVNERQIIASSAREMTLWRQIYDDQISDLNIISENLFIRHIKYLLIGVETNSFPFNSDLCYFYMKENLVIEGISKEHLKGYISPLLLVGTYYKRLYNFAFNTNYEDNFHSKGLIYETAREVIRRYLLEFRLEATKIYEDCCNNMSEDLNCMPTLLQIQYHMEPLKHEIETIVHIYKLADADATSTIPHGAELMSYLFNEISLVTHKKTSLTLYNSLFSICKVYFKFIERFIFEGELDDPHNEFFIRKDSQYVNSRSKRYWDKGFHIAMSVAVPDFLKPLASFILLCGKSLRLLKLCNPNDPLVALLSAAHPPVRCCARWSALARARRVLAVYRTRCLFVAGERASLTTLLLRRDAERKACAELASAKQAETMDKIVAERKRLAQLIIAEKQHSLKVLEAAMAEAKAAKQKTKQRERRHQELEAAAEKATEEVDSRLKEDESNKIMEYYSKLNMEVEKSKIHTEWKIKRLQLDETRMQLLSTEERNLKREKLELEHQRNEATMAMSINEDPKFDDELEDITNDNKQYKNKEQKGPSLNVEALKSSEGCQDNKNIETSKAKTSDVFSAICNVAKSIFGVRKQNETEPCDNEVKVDAQGNVISVDVENNTSVIKSYKTSNEEIGAERDDFMSHCRYLENKQDAIRNKKKVMAHELKGKNDENNQISSVIASNKLTSVDEENNLEDEWSPFVEGKQNKCNVFGAEFGTVENKAEDMWQHQTILAHGEAIINRQKVLSADFDKADKNTRHIVRGVSTVADKEGILNREKNLSTIFDKAEENTLYFIREPKTVADEEAIINRQKVLGADFDKAGESTTYIIRELKTIADREALVNRQKVLGADFEKVEDNFTYLTKVPKTVADKEAVINRQRVLGAECDKMVEKVAVTPREPKTIAHKEAIINRQRVLGAECDKMVEKVAVTPREPKTIAHKEAIINRQRVLGADCEKEKEEEIVIKIIAEPITQAHKEALINKQKVLGVEYNLPLENKIKRELMNVAQEEAFRNKNKVLGSEYELGIESKSERFDSVKKSNLRLNLKPYNETSITKNLCITPNTGAITPGDLIPSSVQLDLETPTTAEIPIDSALTSDIFTPHSEYRELESRKVNVEKEFLTSEGFNFSLIVDEDTAASEAVSDVHTEPDSSPSKSIDFGENLSPDKSIFNILDGSHTLEYFDPFGVKHLQNYSKDYFTNKINAEMSLSCYTHPALIMEEVQKSPSSNIFGSRFNLENSDDEKITCDNIATLTACLQRSVMLPLTYQLEVVNNSILTYFLINLDMYEHLRSLKDYFFLMDGEFSRSICHNLFSKLTKTLNPQELLNFATLHNILDKALGSSILHVHKFSENLSFTIAESPLSFQHSSPDVLQCLSLTYAVGWPLNIILSQEALARYCKVFQFLVKMRRISWVLSEDFENLKFSVKLLRPHSRHLLRSPQYISIQLYRHIMASLIRALDNYIVTTCILTSWTEFETNLKKARTLDDLYECHVLYVKNVLFRCLLNNRSTPVMKLLNDMFTVILKFSRVLKAGEWQQKEPNGSYTHVNYLQLEELFHVFEKIAKYLHKVVTRLTEYGYQRHLVELLTMVNLNGYYSSDRSREDTNNSIQST